MKLRARIWNIPRIRVNLVCILLLERNQMTTVKILDNVHNAEIAEADLDQGDVFSFEGNYYFDAEKVNMDNLEVTDRIYTCPYKGQAKWIDLRTPDGVVKDVAWVYLDPKPGYTQIKGRIGFYSVPRPGTNVVKE
jgi:uncharacterized protein (DUF427 family)